MLNQSCHFRTPSLAYAPCFPVSRFQSKAIAMVTITSSWPFSHRSSPRRGRTLCRIVGEHVGKSRGPKRRLWSEDATQAVGEGGGSWEATWREPRGSRSILEARTGDDCDDGNDVLYIRRDPALPRWTG